jgi:hypothetical protein
MPKELTTPKAPVACTATKEVPDARTSAGGHPPSGLA